MSAIIRMYYCSFCNKDEEKVEFMFVTHKSIENAPCICSECSDLVHDVLTKKRANIQNPPAPSGLEERK